MVHLLLAIIYLAFISLGLPDALLGSAWPMMYQEFEVPVSYMGFISFIISMGTVVSSLMCDCISRRFSPGKITVVSTAMTAVAILGFSISGEYWMLLLWAIPYGLGAGSVDACLNNYVAIHYASRHMSWLHCMWGLGATIGPYIMGFALTGGQTWNSGYRYVGLVQLVITALLLFSLPLWKSNTESGEEEVMASGKALSLKEIISIPGTKSIMTSFFCYCAIEQTAGLWASSYLVLHKGITEETAARFAALFYIGITVGRGVCGFLTMKISDKKMVRLGISIILIGALAMLLPLGDVVALAGIIIIGLGCAPIYPCLIHSTPVHFGADRSQAIIGVQMASAYVGTSLMPLLFGAIANHINVALLPVYILAILVLMGVMHENLFRTTKAEV